MIVVELMGGLGNQLFQYAAGKSLALRNNTELFVDTQFLMSRNVESRHVTYRNYDLDIFTIKPPLISSSVSVRYGNGSSLLIRHIKRWVNRLLKVGHLQYIYERTPYQYDSRVDNLRDNVYLSGYWQSIRYFQCIQQQLREELQFADPIPDYAIGLAKEIRSNPSAVFVHVRRSDFVNNRRHNVVPPVYYQQAERLISERIKTPAFYVFSDDIEWCRTHIRFNAPTVFVGNEWAGNRAQTHLQLMTFCHHFIIPNSTFGWWAAWLNPSVDKVVVAPKKWAYVNQNFISSDELTYPGWLTI
ncbi:glycosyl transferase family 11 [Larkinella arboricola]|uniref:Glycosyl transferase family 11 n=1 Tax=Larkinella arboricola TaxID=643671 RepID=A0A327WZI8_LARAB|nr:alpha-1,2-fucosyltransferase [Larkinella arboricola]RAJ97574.1 glycosyl transferase family 11 [Larkinella arboricola]